MVVVVAVLVAATAAQAYNVTDYQLDVDAILQAARGDGLGYQRLSTMCDLYGPRLSGTPELEQAMDWVMAEMETDGFDVVTSDPVMVTHWVPNSHSLSMSSPRVHAMQILPLGGSISTPADGITAEALVVTSYEDLAAKAAQAEGKIVVYNVPFTSYGSTVTYRTNGAVEAAKVGAIASLTRSVTPYSLYTPHTGVMYYEDGVTKIPAAAVTVEDATLMQRFQDSGHTIVLTLKMDNSIYPESQSKNIVAEITGTVLPEEVVVFGGHIDSWFVGTGAQDDAGGCFHAWEAARILLSLGMKPRRTLRVVFWTAEENGGAGAQQYFDDYYSQLNDTVFCMESDSGTFTPSGLSFAGTNAAKSILQEVADLLRPELDITVTSGGAGADVEPLTQAGVPGAGLQTVGSSELYFNYHHTNADTIDHVDDGEFRDCVGTFAAVAYVIADMQGTLPR